MKKIFLLLGGLSALLLGATACTSNHHSQPQAPSLVVIPPIQETFGKKVEHLRIHISELDSYAYGNQLSLSGVLINDTDVPIVVPKAFSAGGVVLGLTLNGCESSPASEKLYLTSLWGSLVFFEKQDGQKKVWRREEYVLTGSVTDSSVKIPPGAAYPFNLFIDLWEPINSETVKIRLGDGEHLPYSNEIELQCPDLRKSIMLRTKK